MNPTLPLPSPAYCTNNLPSSSSGGGDGGRISSTLPHQIRAPAAATTPIASGDDSEAAALMRSAEAKAVAACKSHKEAERLRRKRINGHLSTLRTLLPDLLKTDKASLLGDVVRRVRELKQATSQLTASQTPSVFVEGDGAREERLLPDETDVVRLRRCDGNGAGGVVIATLSCEDRPDLLSDLSRALKSVKAKVVRAEIATVGGRTKSVLWLQDGGDCGGREGLGALSRALKVVVDRPNCSAFGPGLGFFGPKRQRLYR